MIQSTASEVAGNPPARRKKQFWPRELVLGLLPLLIGFEMLIWIAYLPLGLRGVAVFRTLYTSGYMVRTHNARDIHDPEKLANLSDQLVPLGLTLNQPMDHPAYEALLFAPLSLLPYSRALALFLILNLGVIAWCVKLLQPSLRVLSERWVLFPALLFPAFFPVTYSLTRGADSILLLAILAGALAWLRTGRDLPAGLMVGLGVFKFQIVIPIAVVFLLWKRRRFVLGFAISSATAGLISLLLVGMQGARQYASMLLGMSVNLRSEADAMRYSLSPKTMLNLRGLLSALLGGRIPHWWVQGLILASSFAVLLIVARCRPSLPLSIVAAALVSYHLNAPDATILLIPIGICLCSNSVPVALAATAALIVPAIAINPFYGFIGAIPILGLFFAYALRRGVISMDESVSPLSPLSLPSR
jgi:hypothetical protein